MKPVVVLVPIYKPTLDVLEKYSLDYSLAALKGRDIYLIGPEKLDLSYYNQHYPGLTYIVYPDVCFASIPGYNRLLLNTAFYQQFDEYEFTLILQTDAIVLRDELDYWCNKPFDYIGAPWPDGYGLFVNLGRFVGKNARAVKVMVGNGGLSLRRNKKCIALLQEFSDAIHVFVRTGSSEDLFFSVMSALSVDFITPNEIIASQFAMELKPSYYLQVNGGKAPMGGHAWWKYEPQFWRQLISDMPAGIQHHLQQHTTHPFNVSTEVIMKKTSLDLGCGTRPKNIFNADVVYGIDVRTDLVHNIVQADLVVENIPFEDGFFDFVTAHDFIEHIPRLVYLPQRRNSFIELMNEIWRVLKFGGKFFSFTPAFPNAAAFVDPTHVNIITEQTFPLYFDDVNIWAKNYGFKGAFKIESQAWQGPHLVSILEKVPVPESNVVEPNLAGKNTA